MLENDWNKAMSCLSDDMIAEAADAYATRRRTVWLRVTSIVAALLIVVSVLFWPREDGLVSAPGALTVYAYDLQEVTDPEDMTPHALAEGVIIERFAWSNGINALIMGLPVTLSVDEAYFPQKEVTFDLSIDTTGFYERYGYGCEHASYKDAYLGSNFSVPNNATIYWKDIVLDENKDFQCVYRQVEPLYADIVIRADGMIVGYAVIAIECIHYESGLYVVRLVEEELYPMVNDKMQQIPEEYIEKALERAKV